MIESGLYQLIIANAGFSAIAGNRLYPLVLPDSLVQSDTTPPSATYQTISSVPDYTNDGPVGCVKARVQFDCFAAAYADAKSVSDAIRQTLDGYTGTLPDGTAVLNCWIDNVTDSYSQDTRLYRTSTDYRVIYAQQ
jgi:hypothetical protein